MSSHTPTPMDAADIVVPYSRENKDVRRPRKFQGRGGRSGRGRPSDRTTQWRQKTNARVVSQLDAERNERFKRFGLADPQTAANQQPQNHTQELSAVQFLGMAVTPFAKPVPISTQALGFLVNQYYLRLIEQFGQERITRVCTLFQFYRYSLIQLSYHLYRLRTEIVPKYGYQTELPPMPALPYDLAEAFKSCELNVGYITAYIQRIGVVVMHDVPHVPMLMTQDAPSPFYVNIFTLRGALQDTVNGNNADRADFFLAHNSIPGLRVNAQNRVTNVNVVIPANYGREDVFRDSSAVRALMNTVASKMRDMPLYTGRLGLVEEGNPGILLSRVAAEDDVHIPTSEDINNFQPVTGTVNTFWTHANLTDDQRRLGVLGLYNCVDTSPVYVPTGNEWLHPATASYVVSADYQAYLNRLIG